MSKNRLESFSDGVFAILITIMVLELKTPETVDWTEIIKPAFFATLSAYVLSFLFIASFSISHHTIITPVKSINQKLLWTNNLLLLAVSLLPLVTAWHGRFPNTVAPSVCYLLIYVLSVLGFYLLGQVALSHVATNQQQFCQQTNKIRLHLVVFGLLALLLTFFIPQISSLAIFAILIYWLTNSRQRKKTK